MTTAYRHWEILERSQTGPFMDEDDFLPKHFTPTLKKLCVHVFNLYEGEFNQNY